MLRATLSLGRQCLRRKPQNCTAFLCRQTFFTLPAKYRIPFRPPPKPPRGKIVVWSLLSPAAFVALSEEDTGDGKTPEEHMLEASRAEIAEDIPKELHGLRRACRGFCLIVDTFIVEPIATTFRFLHLVFIFVPVIATMPMLWLGARRPDRDNERGGTLWWYCFLVRSMERAGPAFIKVHEHLLIWNRTSWLTLSLPHSSVNGLLQDQTSSPEKCVIPCPVFTPMLPPIP